MNDLSTMCPDCGATELTGVTCRMCGYPDRKPGDPDPPGFVEEMERRRKPDPRVTVPTPRQSKADPRRTHGG